MAAKRYYYSDSITDFLSRSTNEISGALSRAYTSDINKQTSNSWQEEIETLQKSLAKYANRGSVYFEYNIPRMGRRVDVIALIDRIVFVLEYKTGDQKFAQGAANQVWDYALDLKNFQLGCRNLTIVPIQVVPTEKNRNCVLDLVLQDGVYEPFKVNAERLHEAFEIVLTEDIPVWSQKENDRWAKSGYEPTPTIVEAAVALYEKKTVEDITKHGGDIDKVSTELNKIIKYCRDKKRKAICFITGVPGAGKTLIGLNTAIGEFRLHGEAEAVYLSGNYPLVEVLKEALANDYYNREQEKVKAEKRKLKAEGKSTKGIKGCSMEDARSKVKTFIQMVHHYRDTYAEGIEIHNGHIIPQEGYFESHKDKAYIPKEHVAIFDEAQRAWTKEELQRFMKQKKDFPNFPYSEPEFLISCMDRQTDWGLVVCLVGNGQSINRGEAGLSEWIESIHRSFSHWDVYMSEHLLELGEVSDDQMALIKSQVKKCKDLHLDTSMRSFRAEKVSLFVNQLLALQKADAKATFQELDKYPIVLTRSLETAKQWLRKQRRGSERMGLLASSKADRLKAININVRYQPNFVHWFLKNDEDVRSSNCLEDTLTEFKVQGLEIDWACVAWDADLRLNKEQTAWQHFKLNGGTKWQKIDKLINREYQINAYRVLLTRARQGMVICIPEGDHSVPPDDTRKPEWYDGIYNYLKSLGIKEI